MAISVETTNSISCAKYMTEEKSYLYRVIMRIFLEEHEKLHTQLNQEELYELLSGINMPGFSCSVQELTIALNTLEEWGCLESQTDHTRQFSTVESFKRRQSYYMITNLTLEFERILKKQEQIQHTTLSVERTFKRIADDLRVIDEIMSKPARDVTSWWTGLVADHDILQRTYQEYTREFLNTKTQQIFTTALFVEKKKVLRKYLLEFVKEMQWGRDMISKLLQSVDEKKEQQLIELIVRSTLTVERDMASIRSAEGTDAISEENISQQVKTYWLSLKNWFVGDDCMCARTLTNTNHIIMQISNTAQVLVHTKNFGMSNQADLKKIMSVFGNIPMEMPEDAHKLSSLVFGVPTARHYYDADSRPDNAGTDKSTYDEPPIPHALQTQTRGRKNKKQEVGVTPCTEEQNKANNERIARYNALREEIFSHIKDNKIDFGTIKKPLSSEALHELLRWVSISSTSATEQPGQRRGRNLYGQSYTAQKISETSYCTVPCMDGFLTMPHMVISFDEGAGGENA